MDRMNLTKDQHMPTPASIGVPFGKRKPVRTFDADGLLFLASSGLA